MSFVKDAIDASRIYYDYLKTNNGALVKYDVATVLVKEQYCFLRLKSKLRNLDMLQIKINTTIYSDEQIRIVEYKEESNALKITADKYYLGILSSITPKEIQVIADLKFLIKNIERFYTNYGQMIKLPYDTNVIIYTPGDTCGQSPSSEQINAIECALQYPLSYIWGAPGTGKTRFVLAQCILAYFKNNNNPKLLITAPTNNAVEQMLYGILPVLNENNIELNKVLRLGTASYEFASQYPECCEHKAIEKQAEAIKNQISKIDEEIKQYNNMLSYYAYYDKYSYLEECFNKCKKECNQLSKELSLINDKYNYLSERIDIRNKERSRLKSEINVCKGKKVLLDDSLLKLKKQNDVLSSAIESLTASVQKYSIGLRKCFGKSKRDSYSQKLEKSILEYDDNKQKIDDTKKALNETDNIISYNQKTISSLNDDNQKDSVEKQKLMVEFENYKTQILSFSKDNELYLLAIKITIENHNQIINTLLKTIEQKIEQYQNLKDKALNGIDLSKEEITDIINKLNAKKNIIQTKNSSILSGSTSSRIEECSIIAATVDNCIARLIPNGDFMPMQIFLDETGYCSLIKAASLFAYNAPITLLGDHMQLPPVCEIDPEKLTDESKKLILFCLSAVYIERFEDPIDDLFHLYFNPKKDPDFYYTAFAQLNHSFRFGEKLAEILSNDVYSSSFIGSEEHPTELYYINSEKTDLPKSRTSTTEIKNIRIFLQEQTDTNIDMNDLGILAPYKNQVRLLKKNLPNHEILTVHQSQGREWNTVILSVVDTTDKWFTNSLLLKSNGKNVINTAVSRAKQNLILVCDYNYWITQKKQLIGQILSVSEEIKLKGATD